ncbi:MAG TPA: radical SAM protein, partial [Desulfobulbaceae bacterium]|nr:radical SAM protein [Desulfobulbaceae bacterium]
MPALPRYLSLQASGELKQRRERALSLLASCRLCPRQCGANRLENEQGFCRTGRWAVTAGSAPHFGEERPLVGAGGSGTIFFSHCNLGCVFCQNYEISHLGQGVETTPGQLAAMMLSLQKQGCHNINLVTPSHVAPQILLAVEIASKK